MVVVGTGVCECVCILVGWLLEDCSTNSDRLVLSLFECLRSWFCSRQYNEFCDEADVGDDADDDDCESGPVTELDDGWFDDNNNEDNDRRLGIIMESIESEWMPGMSTPSEEQVIVESSLAEIHGWHRISSNVIRELAL